MPPKEAEPRCGGCGGALGSASGLCPACGAALDSESKRTTEPVTRELPGTADHPTYIGEFSIVRVLGRGGGGTVYEAYQQTMRRSVALKILEAGLFTSSDAIARFEREAWIGGRLTHPNIVRVFSQGTEHGTHYIAMELVDGSSLHENIREARRAREQHLDGDASSKSERIRRIVEMFVDVADALRQVHEQGIVHRDIKPGNLLLANDGSRLLLTDFGLARDTSDSRLTRQGDFLGTVRYMSPEQLLAHRAKVDHRSDIYSLGVSLYEALTLDLPYQADSDEAYVSLVSTKEPALPRVRNRAVPRDLETVLMKCLERDPERRYASVAGLREDLLRFLGGQPVVARRVGSFIRGLRLVNRNRKTVIATALGVLLSGATVWGVLTQLVAREQLRRMRWTLEHVVVTGADPASLKYDWDALQELLKRQVLSDPRGPIADLALEAGAQLEVELSATFGLLSAPPEISVSRRVTLDPGQTVTCLARVEGSLDGGPWLPAGYHFFDPRSEARATLTVPIARLSSSGSIDSGPHDIALRAGFEIFDVAPRGSGCGGGSPERNTGLAAVLSNTPIKRFDRPLGRYTINLFDEYPDNFPRAVSLEELSGPVSSWLRVDRLRVVRVRLPEGTDSHMLEESHGRNTIRHDVSSRAHTASGLVVCIEFEGHLDEGLPLPLAADASILLAGEQQPLVGFPFYIGAGISGPYIGGSHGGDGTELLGLDLPVTPAILPLNIEDRTMQGELRLTPSRAVALEARCFDRYIGVTVAFPVEISIQTVEGRWVGDELGPGVFPSSSPPASK